MKFLCGSAKEKTTPKLGTKLYGYNPFNPCTEVHDDLFVNVIAVGDGKTMALLISADIGDFHNDLTQELRAACAEIAGIDVKNVILHGTHTHCAPNLAGIDGWGEIDYPYLEEIFKPALFRAVRNACDSMAEAEIGVAVEQSDVGINRREYTEDCRLELGQNPWGLYDPDMTVIRIRRCDDKTGIVNLVHYGCHGTACGLAPTVTRDWYGMMLDRLEQITGTHSVFFNGAIGDVGPRLSNGKTVGDISHVEELGRKAALDAVRIANTVSTYRVPALTLKCGTVRLPYQEFPSLETVQAEKACFTNPENLYNIQLLKYKHLCDVEDYLTGKTQMDAPDAYTFEESVLCIDDICFAPFPFEMFTEMSLRLRAYSGYAHTLMLSCANGYNGYLPSQDQLCRGGYEVGVFRYCSLFALADNTDDHIVNETLRIIKS